MLLLLYDQRTLQPRFISDMPTRKDLKHIPGLSVFCSWCLLQIDLDHGHPEEHGRECAMRTLAETDQVDDIETHRCAPAFSTRVDWFLMLGSNHSDSDSDASVTSNEAARSTEVSVQPQGLSPIQPQPHYTQDPLEFRYTDYGCKPDGSCGPHPVGHPHSQYLFRRAEQYARMKREFDPKPQDWTPSPWMGNLLDGGQPGRTADLNPSAYSTLPMAVYGQPFNFLHDAFSQSPV